MTLVELVKAIHLNEISKDDAKAKYDEMDIFEPTFEETPIYTKHDDMSWYDVQEKLVHVELPELTGKECEAIFEQLAI